MLHLVAKKENWSLHGQRKCLLCDFQFSRQLSLPPSLSLLPPDTDLLVASRKEAGLKEIHQLPKVRDLCCWALLSSLSHSPSSVQLSLRPRSEGNQLTALGEKDSGSLEGVIIQVSGSNEIILSNEAATSALP